MPKLYTFIVLLFLLCTVTLLHTVRADTLPTYSPWQQEQHTKPPEPSKHRREALKTKYNHAQKENLKHLFEKPSALEAIYATRLIDEPKQFGYDLFADNNTTQNIGNTQTPMGAVQDDFVLGSGDELQITFTGRRSDQDTYKINTHGILSIKEFPPIPAAGRTIAQLRGAVNAHLSSFHNTQAYVSLSSIRQISVLVVGHVKHPGRKTVNAFHTALDVLMQAGGVQKNGSLRNIKLVRGGRGTIIDLYSLLMHGAPYMDMRLRDGDRIIVPPIGPTVAIAGAVKRSGIYEIKKLTHGINKHTRQNSEKLSLNAMLDFAGGVLTQGNNRFIQLTLTAAGQENVTEISDSFAPIFGDSSILSVLKGVEKRTGTIELIGATRNPGLHDLSKNKTLTSLLQNKDILGDDIYPLIGIIERWDEEQLTTTFIEFPVRLVLKNEFDLKMQDNDVVILLSNQDISDTYNEKNDDSNRAIITEEGSRINDHYATNDPALKSFLKERSVFVRGAVRRPGLYPVSQGTTLDNILAVAGGMTLEANHESIEITSKNLGTGHQTHGKSGTQRTLINLNETDPHFIAISAGDAIRINQKFRKMENRTVLIIGEVYHPGQYDLLASDKVSNLIARAGGITDQAYPAGTIFSRESERRTEEMRFRNAAYDMEQRLALAIERENNPPDTTQIAMVRKLANRLNNIEAVGRITVETNPAILATRPELDMLLEKGDRIYIPKRPLTVRVSGDVLSPASLQFKKDKDPLNYIHEAGGFTYHADKNRTFVLYPDGSAQPLQVNSWNHTPIFIPPGSTIVVPRDPKPFDFIESAKDISQILSNLAITSVFINDIRD
ncbi:MAG: polysaccharide biosynthesis/export family protein [Zetaproteobacteria bacterium]|nr:MAG: polysaccharide biosynthesis/export family protein [Zetaproteobacteria bacterium]